MHDRLMRLGLVVLGVPALIIGVWAAFAPRSFYDDFPGLGRMWVAPDGPYNEHLVRDVGELNLALVVITAIAAFTLVPMLVRAVLAGWVVYSVPHLVYHLRNMSPFSTDDQVSIAASLAFVPILAVALFVIIVRAPRDVPAPRATTGEQRIAARGLAPSHVGSLAVIGLVAAGPQLALLRLLAHDRLLFAEAGQASRAGPELPVEWTAWNTSGSWGIGRGT